MEWAPWFCGDKLWKRNLPYDIVLVDICVSRKQSSKMKIHTAKKWKWIFCPTCYSKNKWPYFPRISHLEALLQGNLESRVLCSRRPIVSNLKPWNIKKRFKLYIPITVKTTEIGCPYPLLKITHIHAIAMSYLLVNQLDKFSLSYKCSIFHAAKEFFPQVYPCVCRILVVSHEDSPSLRSDFRLILCLCFQDFPSLGTWSRLATVYEDTLILV